MKIVCIGGGPAGLYFGLLMKQLDPAHDITVVERNRPTTPSAGAWCSPTPRWTTCASGTRETADADPAGLQPLGRHRAAVQGPHGIRSGGHGFVGIGRARSCSTSCRRAARRLGVKLVFERDVDSDEDYADADLIIASDGINSPRSARSTPTLPARHRHAAQPLHLAGHEQAVRRLHLRLPATEHGWFQAHIYKFDETTTTFIVECPEHVWLAHGLDKADQAESIAFCEKLFADNLQGEKLMTNARHLRGSAWLNFQRVVCEQWWLKNTTAATWC
jgi:anthraniloyl-CoA monooxygenase